MWQPVRKPIEVVEFRELRRAMRRSRIDWFRLAVWLVILALTIVAWVAIFELLAAAVRS